MLVAMGTADEEWTGGVLVLRAWVEADAGNGLRVRITRTAPGGTTEAESSAEASVDGVCTKVRSWLEELLRHRQRFAPPVTADPDRNPSGRVGDA
jgi:hypothetical protein